jgi:hypothetical protein
MQMIAAVHAAGKFASICEFWPHKSLIVGESFLDVDTRDSFNFWAPLDQQYLPIIFETGQSGIARIPVGFQRRRILGLRAVRVACLACRSTPPARRRRTRPATFPS